MWSSLYAAVVPSVVESTLTRSLLERLLEWSTWELGLYKWTVNFDLVYNSADRIDDSLADNWQTNGDVSQAIERKADLGVNVFKRKPFLIKQWPISTGARNFNKDNSYTVPFGNVRNSSKPFKITLTIKDNGHINRPVSSIRSTLFLK